MQTTRLELINALTGYVKIINLLKTAVKII